MFALNSHGAKFPGTRAEPILAFDGKDELFELVVVDRLVDKRRLIPAGQPILHDLELQGHSIDGAGRKRQPVFLVVHL